MGGIKSPKVKLKMRELTREEVKNVKRLRRLGIFSEPNLEKMREIREERLKIELVMSRFKREIVVVLPSVIVEKLAEWRNWQTQRTQNPPSVRTCGFESHLGHQSYAKLGS